MRRLKASDALFLYQERVPNWYMHSMRMSLLDVPEGPPGEASRQVKAAMAVALARPPLWWRLVPTPLGLHHPSWIKDPDFDIDNHLHRIGCPDPGGDAELAEVVSQVASRPLDRARPLWEMWIVDGLASGQVALIFKAHHAVADGVATAQLYDEVTSIEPMPLGDLTPFPFGETEQIPSKPRLLGLAAKDVLSLLSTGPAVFRRIREVRRTLRDRPPEQAPLPGFKAQTTSLNPRRLAPQRRFAFTSFDLSEIKTIRAVFGVTMNDVFLAVCAGAVRRMLLDRDELPEDPLIGVMPLSTRTPEEQGAYGTRVTVSTVRLPTHIEDPVERLAAAKAHADITKADLRDTRGARPEDVMELFPPALHRLLVGVIKTRTTRGMSVLGNVALSNVPGPRKPMYLGETKTTAAYGCGPLAPGLGLNITAWSYVDRLNLALLSDGAVLPDLWPLVGLLRESLSELHSAALVHTSGGTDG